MESCGEGEGDEGEEGEEGDDGDDMSQNSNSSKRQRRDSGGRSGSGSRRSSSSDNINKDYSNSIPMDLWTVYVDSEADVGGADTRDRTASSSGSGGRVTPPPPLLPGDNNDRTATRSAAAAAASTTALLSNMVTTSIAERAPSGATKETFAYGDWEEIKEMLAWASELCDDRAFGSFAFIMPVLSPPAYYNSTD